MTPRGVGAGEEQASFDPPGITVAVKQDRAVESFMARGTKFIVNVLAEGREKALVKAMLKPFKPGEDRFAGLDVQVRPCCTLNPTSVRR